MRQADISRYIGATLTSMNLAFYGQYGLQLCEGLEAS